MITADGAFCSESSQHLDIPMTREEQLWFISQFLISQLAIYNLQFCKTHSRLKGLTSSQFTDVEKDLNSRLKGRHSLQGSKNL